MAGDWIKMRIDLRRHPKVVRMASACGADRYRVIGGLLAVWAVFDEQTEDGHLDGYTPAVMDEEIGWPGFSASMISVGWLQFHPENGLSMPEFGEHNGQSAKRRASETKRKRLERAGDVRDPSASDADTKRPRGEGEKNPSSSSLRSEEEGGDARPTPGEACKAMKAAGMASVSPSSPDLIALLDAGITLSELIDATKYAVEKQKPFAYALKTAEGRRRDAAAIKPLPAAQRGTQNHHDRRAATLAGLTDTGEHHHADRDCRTVDVEAHIVA